MNQTTKGKWLFLLILLFPLLLLSEEVCKISYKDFPENLKDMTIEAPANAVSLSEAVRIKKADDSSVVIMNTPAILFVLDNSGSMYIPHRSNSDTVQYNLALDPEGNRFSVTEAMIDSLYVQDPNAEVGLIVYGSELHFEKTDVVTKYIDPDDPFNFANGAFVTFLQLNKEYTEKSTTRTGYEFLKYYLETEELSDRIVFKDENDTTKIILDTVVTFTMLKHLTRTAVGFDSGTDITMAFKGVKESLNHTAIEKHLQYTVFFSDGIPSSGGMEMWDFVKGEGIPTTYTVFFHPDKIAPDSLISMNENIKKNNYSSNNENSELWAFDNSGHDELLDFMIENVLNKIKGEITTEPVEITINGKKSGEWIDGVFTFEDQFPLTAEKSAFTFDIQYDIITKKSDSSTTIEKVHDTVAFFVQRETTPDLLDSVTVERWDRSIVVREGGSDISIIAEGTKELELLFEEKKIDCNYQYEDVELVIQSVNYGDTLILPLNKLDEHRFSENFKLDFKEDGDPLDDDLLQLSPEDEVTIFFQNKKLPLDTLTISIATNVTYRLRFHDAIYYDNNGDGEVDTIRMPFSANFNLQESHIDEVVKSISLPDYRELHIERVSVEGNTFVLTVTEGSGKLQTAVNSEDVVSVKETEIDFFELKQVSLNAIDSMAPVLDFQTVSLTENVDGATFSVRFTEPVDTITSNEPLRFYDSNDDFYRIELEVVEATENEYTFLVTSSDKSIETGDSLHINFSGVHVTDLKGNSQEIPSNVKRRVSTSAVIDVDRGAYFDMNADGFVDCVKLFYSSLKPLSKESKALFEEAIVLPEFRKFSVESIEVEDDHVVLLVTEKRKEMQTFCSQEDIIQIAETEMNDLLIGQKSISVIDSVAPVLLDKKVEMSRSKDRVTLTAHFSEELQEIQSDEPLHFHRGETVYVMKLDKSSNTTLEYTFSVTENAKVAQSGDSVNIWSGAHIADLAGNQQGNDNNTKRELVVKDELSFSEAIFYDKNSDGNVDLLSIQFEQCRDSLALSVDEIIELFTFPAYRELEVDVEAVKVTDSTLYIPLVENIEKINTACGADDMLVINADALGNYVISDDTLLIIDSMAPVISQNPVLYLNTMDDEIPDTLKVHFSEEVLSINSDQPFRFFHNGKSFLGTLELEEHNNESALFSVLSFDGGVEELFAEDSVNIHEAVVDLVGNEQRDRKNIKRPLDVKIVLPKIDFKLKALTPFNPERTVVPDEVIALVDEVEKYDLTQSDSGYVGDLITLSVIPRSILSQLDFTIEAEISILDKVGNVILPQQKMEFLDDMYSLVYLWNGKNSLGRVVGKDSFLLVCQVRLVFSDGQTFEARKELILATNEEE